jgi:hypothetical protein
LRPLDQVEAVVRDQYRGSAKWTPAHEPKSVLWDECRDLDEASFLAEIIDSGVEIVS